MRMLSDPLTAGDPLCRTLTEIHRNVVKQGKRNAVSRFIRAKSDKDKVTAWKQDLVRVLHVFNVRFFGSV